MSILLTGGAGYIGSHAAIEMIKAGFDIVIIDSLVNSTENVLSSIEKITGKRPSFLKADIRDEDALRKIFSGYKIEAVCHLI